MIISAAVNREPETLNLKTRTAILERSWSRPVVEVPAASHKEKPRDIPHRESRTLPELEAPLGIPDSMLALSDPGRGSSLGIGTTAAGSGSGRDDGKGRGARGARGTGGRHDRASGGGGSPEKNAIEAALKWLAKQQKSDGSWSLSPSWEKSRWRFPVSRAGSAKMAGSAGDATGTALALLAYSGAGYSESGGKYAAVARRGLTWLRKWQTGQKYAVGEPHTSALAALAFSEATGRSGSAETKAAAQSAIDALCRHYQSSARFRPFLVSEAAWAAMAFRAAEAAGLKIKTGAKKRLESILRAGRRAHGNFAYKVAIENSELKPVGKGFPYATSAGTAALLCLGGSPRENGISRSAELALAKAVKAKRCFGTGDFLRAHHAAVAAALMGSDFETDWRKTTIKPTLARQIAKGTDAGAWPTKMTGYLWNGDKPNQGNVFATALGAMILESTLRHSPLYR